MTNPNNFTYDFSDGSHQKLFTLTFTIRHLNFYTFSDFYEGGGFWVCEVEVRILGLWFWVVGFMGSWVHGFMGFVP